MKFIKIMAVFFYTVQSLLAGEISLKTADKLAFAVYNHSNTLVLKYHGSITFDGDVLLMKRRHRGAIKEPKSGVWHVYALDKISKNPETLIKLGVLSLVNKGEEGNVIQIDKVNIKFQFNIEKKLKNGWTEEKIIKEIIDAVMLYNEAKVEEEKFWQKIEGDHL